MLRGGRHAGGMTPGALRPPSSSPPECGTALRWWPERLPAPAPAQTGPPRNTGAAPACAGAAPWPHPGPSVPDPRHVPLAVEARPAPGLSGLAPASTLPPRRGLAELAVVDPVEREARARHDVAGKDLEGLHDVLVGRVVG